MRRTLSLSLVILLLFASFAPASAQTATPTPGLDVFCGTPAPTWTPPPTWTPAPSSTPQPSYSDNVLSLSPIAYWKLDETSGSVATDYSGNGYNGTYSGVTLNAATAPDGSPAPTFDGVNDYVNVYSAGLSGAFDGNEGSYVAWIYATNPTDASERSGLNFYTGTNRVGYRKPAGGLASVFIRLAGGINQFPTVNVLVPTSFTPIALTWSDSADQLRTYYAGTLRNTTTGLGTFSGSILSTHTTIGAYSTSAVQPWYGAISHVAVFNYALSASQITTVSTIPGAPPPTPTPVPTFTPVPSPTPYPECVVLDPEYYWTVVPPNGTPGVGQAVRYSYSMTAGDVGVSLLLGALLITLWVTFLLIRRKANNGSKPPPRKT